MDLELSKQIIIDGKRCSTKEYLFDKLVSLPINCEFILKNLLPENYPISKSEFSQLGREFKGYIETGDEHYHIEGVIIIEVTPVTKYKKIGEVRKEYLFIRNNLL